MSALVDFDACLFEAVAAASEAGEEIKAAWLVERDVEYKAMSTWSPRRIRSARI